MPIYSAHSSSTRYWYYYFLSFRLALSPYHQGGGCGFQSISARKCSFHRPSAFLICFWGWLSDAQASSLRKQTQKSETFFIIIFSLAQTSLGFFFGASESINPALAQLLEHARAAWILKKTHSTLKLRWDLRAKFVVHMGASWAIAIA